MKKSLLHIEEDLELNMTLEEFEAWQDRNISKKRFVFRTIFFSWNSKGKSFFVEQKEETLILRHISHFVSFPRAKLNFKSSEPEQKVVLRTEIQNAWMLYVFDVFLVSIAVFAIALTSWSRSIFSDEPFVFFTWPLGLLICFFIIMFSIQLGFLRFCVNYLHRKIKESLLRE